MFSLLSLMNQVWMVDNSEYHSYGLFYYIVFALDEGE